MREMDGGNKPAMLTIPCLENLRGKPLDIQLVSRVRWPRWVRVNFDRCFLVFDSDSPHDMCRPAISGRLSLAASAVSRQSHRAF